jgi:hypothetical protein
MGGLSWSSASAEEVRNSGGIVWVLPRYGYYKGGTTGGTTALKRRQTGKKSKYRKKICGKYIFGRF